MTKNSYTVRHLQNPSPLSFCSIYNKSLLSITVKRIYPFPDLTTNALSKQLAFKKFMGRCITQVNSADLDLKRGIHAADQHWSNFVILLAKVLGWVALRFQEEEQKSLIWLEGSSNQCPQYMFLSQNRKKWFISLETPLFFVYSEVLQNVCCNDLWIWCKLLLEAVMSITAEICCEYHPCIYKHSWQYVLFTYFFFCMNSVHCKRREENPAWVSVA